MTYIIHIIDLHMSQDRQCVIPGWF